MSNNFTGNSPSFKSYSFVEIGIAIAIFLTLTVKCRLTYTAIFIN